MRAASVFFAAREGAVAMTLLKAIAALAAIMYVGVVAAMYIFQRDLQYVPSHDAPTPEMMGLADLRVERLPTSDGEVVELWYAAAAADKPTILFFHGNAGEMADRAPRLAAYRGAGFGVAFLSYRGYGGSTGAPSEAGFLQDARAAYYWLMLQEVPHNRLVVVGESLGTGVAVKLAATVPVGAVVLEAPYASAVEIAAATYPWLPVHLLMKDQFRSIDEIDFVSAPLLILHGTDDRVIPYASGERLFDVANAPKEFITLDGAGHDALFKPEIWAREIDYLNTLFAP
jgi:uncharacterized protein